jgi:hypothetical protein
MQQAVQNTSPLERNITVSIPVERIEAEIATRLKKLARTVKMQGFRPGHVPIKMVERHYGFQVRQEVVTDEVQQRFADAVKDQNYRVAGYPRFQPVPGERRRFERRVHRDLRGVSGDRRGRPHEIRSDAPADAGERRGRRRRRSRRCASSARSSTTWSARRRSATS